MGKIKKVKNFSVEDVVIHDGKRCKIVEFPTRYTVCIKNLEYDPGDFSTAKVSVRDIKEANDGKNRKPLSERLPEHIFERIHQDIGQASMCWENIGKAGIFDAKKAGEIAFELCHFIADVMDNRHKEKIVNNLVPHNSDIPEGKEWAKRWGTIYIDEEEGEDE